MRDANKNVIMLGDTVFSMKRKKEGKVVGIKEKLTKEEYIACGIRFAPHDKTSGTVSIVFNDSNGSIAHGFRGSNLIVTKEGDL